MVPTDYNLFENKEKNNKPPKKTLGMSNKVIHIYDEFNKAYQADSENRERNSEAWRLYSGINGTQWDEAARNKLISEGRNPTQLNIIRGKVNGLAGSFVKNWIDVDFEPLEDQYGDAIKILKRLYYSDKELCDWDKSYLQVVIDGLIYRGIEYMYVTDKYDPLGNIAFERIMPGHVVFDPNWLTNDSRDLKRLWRAAYLSADELKEKYKFKSELIDDLILIQARNADDYDNGDENQGFPRYNLNEEYGRLYRVIEYHEIKTEKKTVEITLEDGLILPDGDEKEKRKFIEFNAIDVSKGIIEKEIKQDYYYVSTCVPSLSKHELLEDRKGYLQLGRLPFFHWSAFRINGRDSGVPELLKSIQQTYNKRESLLDEMISTSSNGAMAIDPEIVENDPYRLEELQRYWNNPRFKFLSAPGAISSGRNFFQEVPRASQNYQIVEEMNRMVDMADRISQHPAALSGRSEHADESGILYARKQMQAEIANTTLQRSLENYWNEKGEAYFNAAKQLYSHVYRKIMAPGGKKMELNVPVVDETGQTQVINDISKLPRSRVIVKQSPEGVSVKSTDRAINTELLRVVGDEPLIRAELYKNIMKTLDGSSEERLSFEEAAELQKLLAKERTMAEIDNLRATRMQINTAMQGAMQQQQGGGGQQPQQGQQKPVGNPAQSLDGNQQMAVSQ